METSQIRPVEVRDVLEARDRRAAMQRELLAVHGLPLVSFSMNIAGPVKLDGQIEAAFREGVRRIENQLRWHGIAVRAKEETVAFTGCECLWAADGDADRIKAWMQAIEESSPLGRLFDIDVIALDGAKLSRERPRKCLICGEAAAACARSRAHSVDELFHRAQRIIADWQEAAIVQAIGECAERALHFEALVTPKPGLVDRADSGAHSDMDIFSFAASATALRGYFEACAGIGLTDSAESLEQLRFLGRSAEEAMLRATGGVNTHKGAVFALGILCCAAARAQNREELFRIAAEIAKPALADFSALREETAVTGGERQYLRAGLTGARGEAASGFPSVREIALPALQQGKGVNEAGLRALTALMARVQDSNILRRKGSQALQGLQLAAQNALEKENLEEAMAQLNQSCIRENISPGGSADLLAAAYFVTFWEESKPCLQS